jgi:MFS family permease
MAAYFATLRLLSRDARLLLLMFALVGFAYFGIQTVLVNLYLLRLGFRPEFIGLMISFGQLSWAMAAVPAGIIGAHIGLRNSLVASTFLIGLGATLFLWVERVPPAWQAPWLVAWWMVLWLGAALGAVNGTPYMTAVTGPAERNHAFAAQQAVIALLALLGSLVAGILPPLLAPRLGVELSDPSPYRIALWIAPIIYCGALLTTLCMRPAASTHAARDTAVVSSRPVYFLVGFFLMTLLISIADGSVRAFFNLYLDDGLMVPVSQIGAIMGISQLLPVVAALAAPLFIARFGLVRAIWGTALSAALGLMLLAALGHWVAAAGGYMVVLGALGASATARVVFGQESVEAQWRTATAAWSVVGLALGWAMMAAAAGYLITSVGYAALFLAGAGCAVASAMVTVLWWGRKRAIPSAPAPGAAA